MVARTVLYKMYVRICSNASYPKLLHAFVPENLSSVNAQAKYGKLTSSMSVKVSTITIR